MPLYNPPAARTEPNGFVRLPNGMMIKASVTVNDGVKNWKIILKDTDNEEKEVISI